MAKYYDIDAIITDEEVETHAILCWVVLLPTLPNSQPNYFTCSALAYRLLQLYSKRQHINSSSKTDCKFHTNWSWMGVDGIFVYYASMNFWGKGVHVIVIPLHEFGWGSVESNLRWWRICISLITYIVPLISLSYNKKK